LIREATATDVEPAADTLTAAFADYAFTRHTISADRHLERLREFQRIFLTEIGIPHGRVWVSKDLRAVAVWSTPAGDATATLQALLPRLIELAGDRAEAYASAEATMATHRPTTPTWFLGPVGVDPSAQGRGLGRAVLAPGLESAEAEGTPAFLETSDRRNVHLYRSLGFGVDAEYVLPDGGPHTWAMTRKPPTL